ncbi:MAG: MFS transporter [Planctomycetia bacterium]|nr:MFS transporter [Planctomycetia bacterium]
MQDSQTHKQDSSSAALPPLWTRGFIALLVTQFMVALNDNLFRWLIIPIGKWAVGWSDKQDALRTIGSLAFVVPFIFLATYAGYVCDRFNRRHVIIGAKIAELLIMLLGSCAILTQSVPFMLVTLFLMASQSTFFSPAKYGSLPNLVNEKRISEANGYISMTTMIACIGGQILGGVIFVWTTMHPEAPVEGTGGMHHWFIWFGAIISVAILGLISSFFIPSIPAADPNARFPWNPLGQTIKDLRFLFNHRFLFWIALASSFFWGLGALGQLNTDKFATQYLSVRQDWCVVLLVALSLGLAFGSLLSGKLSRGKIELGLVPIGAVMIVFFCVLLSFTPAVLPPEGAEVASPLTFGFIFGAAGLLGLGLSAGLYDIPLLTTLQVKSPEQHRGRIIAAYNFMSFTAMAVFSVVQFVLAASPHTSEGAKGTSLFLGLNAAQIWLGCAVITLPTLFFCTRAFALPVLKILVTLWLRLVYGMREYDVANIPEEGPVLLIGNHVSFLDALIVYCSSPRPVRFISDLNFLPKHSRLAQYVIRKTRVIQFVPGDRKSDVHMIREAQDALRQGEVVCIFPEGAITRNGQVRAFKPGFLAIVRKLVDTPIVPFAITGLYGSRFAYAKYKGYRRPAPYSLAIAYGKPQLIPEIADKTQWARISQRMLHDIQELYVDTIDYRKHPENVKFLSPARMAIRGIRLSPNKQRLADSTGKEATGRQALLQILVLRRVLHRIVGDAKFVGVALPTSVAGVLVNLALSFDHRTIININYTFTNDINNYCLNKVGVQTVLTSSQLLKKLPNFKLNANLLILEDVARAELRTSDKLIGLIESLLPTWLLERILGLHRQKLSDINTIVFTSGSTGMPKGTVLTNANIVANLLSFCHSAMPDFTQSLVGTLPFFHSFGYTVTCWFPMICPYRCVYHYNPLDYRGVAELVKKYKPDLFISTPTFLRTYLRKCSVEDLKTLNFVIPGAEKTPKDLYNAWYEKFGYDLCEGYGATELSPVLCHNIPEFRAPDSITPYHKNYSIGMPGPGFVAKVVDLATGEETPPNVPGSLLVKGNSVTNGYYEDPERTSKIFWNGWYVTGDVARIDEDNFIFITGRETRISKIGGEMAPHVLIEEKLIESINALVRAKDPNFSEEESNFQLVVTAVPDERKGERLVVLCHDLPVAPEEICKKVSTDGLLPILWVPAPTNFKQVDAIPVLGTGKLDLKKIKELALSLYGVEQND